MPRITSHQSPSSPCSLLSSCKSISNLLFQTALIASPGSDFNCNAKRQTACGGGHLQPSSFCTSLRVALSLAASCHIGVSLPSRSPYQGSSEREGSGQGAPTVAGAARSDPALLPRAAAAFRRRLSKTHLPRPRTHVGHNGAAPRLPSRLSSKKKNWDKRTRQKETFSRLPSP